MPKTKRKPRKERSKITKNARNYKTESMNETQSCKNCRFFQTKKGARQVTIGHDTMEKAASLFMYLEGKTAYEMDADTITRLWRAAFSCALRDMGLPPKARRLLWDELAAGNWTHYRQQGEESRRDARHWALEFGGDVLYCSDRWSIDRVTRCHWAYRQLMDALRAEQR